MFEFIFYDMDNNNIHVARLRSPGMGTRFTIIDEVFVWVEKVIFYLKKEAEIVLNQR